MYLKQTRRGGRAYLSICESYRDGGKVRTRTIETLGYADELARDHADPVAFGRARAAELSRRARQEGAGASLAVGAREQIEMGGEAGISLGRGVALAYLRALGAGAFLRRRIGGEEGAIAERGFEFLASDRMLHAAPIHEAWRSRAAYPGKAPGRFQEVCQALEILSAQSGPLVRHLNRAYERMRGPREASDVRLVMSNYVFRSPTGPAAAGLDELGGGGFWRLWLAIDGQGMPLSFQVLPRDLSCERVLELAGRTRRDAGARRVTLVATELPEAPRAMAELERRGDAFVLLLPASSYGPDIRQWTREADGWRATRGGRYLTKSRWRPSAGPAGGRMREIAFRPAGEAQAAPLCLVSSGTAASERAIFNVYRELWRVHEPFSIVSADFISVPWPLGVREHLEAHFLVCYAAFFAMRLLRQDMGWRYDAAEVADALCRMEGVPFADGWQLFGYRSEVSDAVEAAAGCPQGLRIMRRSDVRRSVGAMARSIRQPREC